MPDVTLKFDGQPLSSSAGTRAVRIFAFVLAACLTNVPMHAQFLGTSATGPLHDLSLLKPPAGSEVAIVDFEDLGCPDCAASHPIVLKVAAAQHVPIVLYDYPIPRHIWTFQGAVYARYIQHIDPKLADEYRSDLFKSQASIANKDDIQRYTQLWLQRHGQQMPANVDPTQSLAHAVQADYDLGHSISLKYTPTIVVVTRDKQQVVCGSNDTDKADQRLPAVVEAAIAQSRKTAAPAHPVALPHKD